MPLFGPFYPPRLQRPVYHAERLAAFLARGAQHSHGLPEWSRTWLHGRADEIERFVELVASDWRAEACSLEAAASALEGYLEFLHEGLAIHLGLSEPACCVGLEPTVIPDTPARLDTIDRLLGRLQEHESGPTAIRVK